MRGIGGKNLMSMAERAAFKGWSREFPDHPSLAIPLSSCVIKVPHFTPIQGPITNPLLNRGVTAVLKP